MANSNNNQFFQIFSVFSWLLLIATSLAAFGVPETQKEFDYTAKSFWYTMGVTGEGVYIYSYYPNLMYFYIYYACFSLLAAFFVFSFCIIVNHLYIKKDNGVDGLFVSISQYHCIPLLCTSALYIIGEINDINNDKASLAFNFIFTLAALSSLIFIHYKTESLSKIANIIIKQAAFGLLIALLVYNLFFGIYLLGLHKRIFDDYKSSNDIIDFIKNYAIAFSIAVGIMNLGLSLALKNAMVSLANLFIYIAMTIWFFKIPENIRDKQLNGVIVGIIEIAMIILSLSSLSLLYYKFKTQIFG